MLPCAVLSIAMTEEEFNRIKEEEKSHQRQIRALKEAVRLLERQRSVTTALEEMTSRSRDALEAHERLIEEIARETALNEARLDVALESQAPDAAALEEAGAEVRAKLLVERLRHRLESSESERTPKRASVQEDEAEEERRPATGPADPASGEAPPAATLPEKTLGRMRAEPDQDER